MKMLKLPLLTLSLLSLSVGALASMECFRFDPLPVTKVPERLAHVSIANTVESYLQYNRPNEAILLKQILDVRVNGNINGLSSINVESLSQKFVKGCETEIVWTTKNGDWGKVARLTSYKFIDAYGNKNSVCSYTTTDIGIVCKLK